MSTFNDDTTETRTTVGDDTTENRTTVGDDTTDHTRHLAPHDTEPRALPRPKGPSWSTIALGLVCLVVAGGALLVEFTELSLEWDRTGPLALVGLGLLLVLVGLAALMRRGDDDEEQGLDR